MFYARWPKIVIAVFCVLLILTLLGMGFGFQLSLLFNGLEARDVWEGAHGFDAEGTEFKVVQTVRKDTGEPALVMLHKKLGFWVCTTISDKSPEEPYVLMAWIQKVNQQMVGQWPTAQTEINGEAHALYYGNNATSLIRIPYEEVRGNAAMMVEQWGETYFLHIIYSGPAPYFPAGPELLKNFISTSEKTQDKDN